MSQSKFMITDAKRSIYLLIQFGIMVVVASCTPMERKLTYDEEMRIQEHTRQSQQPLRLQDQEIEQQIIDCEKQTKRLNNRKFADHLLEVFIGEEESKCDNISEARNKKRSLEEDIAIETIIDKQLNKALEKANNTNE